MERALKRRCSLYRIGEASDHPTDCSFRSLWPGPGFHCCRPVIRSDRSNPLKEFERLDRDIELLPLKAEFLQFNLGGGKR